MERRNVGTIRREKSQTRLDYSAKSLTMSSPWDESPPTID